MDSTSIMEGFQVLWRIFDKLYSSISSSSIYFKSIVSKGDIVWYNQFHLGSQFITVWNSISFADSFYKQSN